MKLLKNSNSAATATNTKKCLVVVNCFYLRLQVGGLITLFRLSTSKENFRPGKKVSTRILAILYFPGDFFKSDLDRPSSIFYHRSGRHCPQSRCWRCRWRRRRRCRRRRRRGCRQQPIKRIQGLNTRLKKEESGLLHLRRWPFQKTIHTWKEKNVLKCLNLSHFSFSPSHALSSLPLSCSLLSLLSSSSCLSLSLSLSCSLRPWFSYFCQARHCSRVS